VHDFNPGIKPSGLFWTAPISRDNIRISLAEGSASLHVSDLEIEDYHDVVNALQDGPSVPATVSFDVTWSGNALRMKIQNSDVGFAGQYVRNSATAVWSAGESDFRFHSNPLTSGFATIGHHRNGTFFRR
jgi:hypothetical protein